MRHIFFRKRKLFTRHTWNDDTYVHTYPLHALLPFKHRKYTSQTVYDEPDINVQLNNIHIVGGGGGADIFLYIFILYTLLLCPEIVVDVEPYICGIQNLLTKPITTSTYLYTCSITHGPKWYVVRYQFPILPMLRGDFFCTNICTYMLYSTLENTLLRT